MAGHVNMWTNKAAVVRCAYPLRDGSPCQAGARLDGRCTHHRALEVGVLTGWEVSGSRKAALYKAVKGHEQIFTGSAEEMVREIKRRHRDLEAEAA